MTRINYYALIKYPPTWDQSTIRQAQSGDDRAMERLIRENLPFIIGLARKQFAKTFELDDMVSFAIIGFIKAVHRFDYTKSTNLLSYATFWIRAELKIAYERNAHTIRLPSPCSNYAKTLWQDHMEIPDSVAMLQMEANLMVWLDYHPDQLKPLLNYLDAHERAVVVKFFGLDGSAPIPNEAMAELYGITAGGFHHKMKKILRKLRQQAMQLNNQYHEHYGRN